MTKAKTRTDSRMRALGISAKLMDRLTRAGSPAPKRAAAKPKPKAKAKPPAKAKRSVPDPDFGLLGPTR
jgi:hypothetical protein